MLTLLLVLTVGIFFSYSRATLKKQESVADATLKVGTLSYTLKMNGAVNTNIHAISGWSYVDIEITNNNPIDTKYEVVYNRITQFYKATVEYFGDHDAPSGVIKAGETKKTRLRIHNPLSSSFTEELQLKVIGSLMNDNIEKSSKDYVITKAEEYKEDILNGTDPVLSSNLIPVNISATGAVTKASKYDAWYEYGQRRWANAVVLVNKNTTYSDGATIPESNIQSYFVWIPRYKYRLFNMGNYSDLTSLSTTAVQTIDIVFENKNTAISTGTKIGDYHSHPAFQAFNSNGFWVGKFESGYKGATSTTGAEQNTSNYTNLIIKPNVYSWRGITVGNAFKVSYDYLRGDESHMMKNTEWGAVAYLQHSSYGSRTSVRINNNSSYKTGYSSISEPTCGRNTSSSSCNPYGTDSSVTKLYNTATGYIASTTGNITGVYDMSGGTHEFVMGYNSAASTVGGSSGITALYSTFFTSTIWKKYYDQYTSGSTRYYYQRILGDATGEMGPFATQESTNTRIGSWYNDHGQFLHPDLDYTWMMRGGRYLIGNEAGIFSFNAHSGSTSPDHTFRVVLTPQ